MLKTIGIPVNGQNEPVLKIEDFKKIVDIAKMIRLWDKLNDMVLIDPPRTLVRMDNDVQITKDQSLRELIIETPRTLDSMIDNVDDSVCSNILLKLPEYNDCLYTDPFNQFGLDVDMYDTTKVLGASVKRLHDTSVDLVKIFYKDLKQPKMHLDDFTSPVLIFLLLIL
ncbi:hypothetical protein MHBO_003754 [Bonamia ostreae]|uniref:Uncharacterized protein n=1 Tax=Bonamia ostreae TaxID=126728 RepID=A0ABV2ARE2_9EUKA